MPHPLADLQAQAAVASGWPTLHVEAPDEEALLHARAAVEGLLGPLPQADELEPWEDDEPWELRADLPGLALADWTRLAEALARAGFAPELVAGPSPAVRAALDLVHRDVEEIAAGGVVASMGFDPVEGMVVGPDLAPIPPDEALVALEGELVRAVRSVDPALQFRSDRGPDTVDPVVDRASGRVGLRLAFAAGALESPDLRERLVGALGGVVAARREHPDLRLAPDLLWDPRLGSSFVLWRICELAPALPREPSLVEGASPPAGDLALLVSGLDGLASELELQVAPRSPADHDAVVDAVSALAAAHGARGGAPRWLGGPGGPAFCPVWCVSPDDRLAQLVAHAAAVPGVAAVRVVPGEPAGMAEIWARIQPAWHLAHGRCFVRYRDGLTERDWLAPAADRRRDARDDRLAMGIGVSLLSRPDLLLMSLREGRPIRDQGLERDGLEVSFDGELRGADLGGLFRALGGARAAEVASLVSFAFRPSGLVVRFWYRSRPPG